MPIPDDRSLDSVQDVLDPWCTDQFLIATLVYVDASGCLMGPADDLLKLVRERADEIMDLLEDDPRASTDDGVEDALADALREVFAPELDKSTRQFLHSLGRSV